MVTQWTLVLTRVIHLAVSASVAIYQPQSGQVSGIGFRWGHGTGMEPGWACLENHNISFY